MSRPPLVLVLSIGALASAGPGAVAPRTVTSPDGRIAIVFDVADGKPSYAVQYDGRPVIEPSALGIQLRGAPPLRDGLVIQDAAVEDVDLVWKPVFGTRSKIANRYRRLSVTLRESRAAGRFFRIDFRAYDDGVGFRYEIPRQPGLDRVEITGEETRIRFPENEKCFALLRKGFGDNYEGTYDPMGLSEIAPAALVGLPLLVEGDGHWVAVTEADLTDYAGLWPRSPPFPTRRACACGARRRSSLRGGPSSSASGQATSSSPTSCGTSMIRASSRTRRGSSPARPRGPGGTIGSCPLPGSRAGSPARPS
jgi:alpha-glucosidase